MKVITAHCPPNAGKQPNSFAGGKSPPILFGSTRSRLPSKIRETFGCDTVFATFKTSSSENPGGFEVLPLDGLLERSIQKYDHVLLHYVNYGFQKRGVPFRLLTILQALVEQHRGRMVTIFHELYASGPPWTSAFWVRPLQF